jgi:hypothetical protein
MIDAILSELVALGYLNANVIGKRVFDKTLKLKDETITQKAQEIAEARSYPAVMANRTVNKR